MDLGPLDDDDKWLLERFREMQPKEIDSICKLAPLQKNDALIDPLLRRLFDIVAIYQRRLSDTEDYSGRVLQSIRSVEAAARNFGSAIDGIMQMDISHTEQTLFFAQKIYPRCFEKHGVLDFVRTLKDSHEMMVVLAAAIKLATGIFDQHRGRGRPPSPYTQASLELINAWEFYTAERPAWRTGWIIKRVPTPKKLDVERPKGGQPRYETKQPSTEFVRLGLRMIKPAISDSEVFTAIKNALKVRDQLSELTEATQKEPWFRLLTGKASD